MRPAARRPEGGQDRPRLSGDGPGRCLAILEHALRTDEISRRQPRDEPPDESKRPGPDEGDFTPQCEE